MNYRGRLLLSLAMLAGSSMALQSQTTSRTLSQNELKRQIAEAHTPEQYRALATYYSQQADRFRTKATEEKAEWDRRRLTTVSIAQNTPPKQIQLAIFTTITPTRPTSWLHAPSTLRAWLLDLRRSSKACLKPRTHFSDRAISRTVFRGRVNLVFSADCTMCKTSPHLARLLALAAQYLR